MVGNQGQADFKVRHTFRRCRQNQMQPKCYSESRRGKGAQSSGSYGENFVITNGDYFIRESVRHARSLAIPEAITYLRGMLFMTVDDTALQPVRATLNSLTRCDQQLELIASGQMKLPLVETSRAKKSASKR